MCPPRNAALRLLHDGGGAAEKLRDEPEEEDDAGRKSRARPEADEGGDERVDAVAREEREVRAKHAGDRAGRPEHGDIAPEKERKFRQRRDDAGREVEGEEAKMPEAPLHVIAEDPQVPHVEEDVGETSVEELRRDKAPEEERIEGRVQRYQRPCINEGVEVWRGHLEEEHGGVRDDEADRDDRNALARLVVAEGQHTCITSDCAWQA